MGGGGGASSPVSSLPFLLLLLPRSTPCWCSHGADSEVLGRREGQGSPQRARAAPPKKRRSHRYEMVVTPVVSRPWYERPPPGYPLPLYAHADDSGGRSDERRRPRQGRGRRAMEAHTVAPGVHAVDSSREFVLWAAMPPSTWILLPRVPEHLAHQMSWCAPDPFVRT